MRTYVVIPARYASTRLPNKMLLRDTGRTILEHTYRAACAAQKPLAVIVATDHADILSEVRRFGGQAVLTSPDCVSGTDRVAEVARELTDADLLVNLQGDEPEINPDSIDQVVGLLEAAPSVPMATLATPIDDIEKVTDPACVKVVFDTAGRALYFSRSPIPHLRDKQSHNGMEDVDLASHFFQHIGLYAFRREFLLRLADCPPSPLEQAEKLEQLRVLQMGETIQVGVTDHVSQGIDTLADYQAFVSRQQRRAG